MKFADMEPPPRVCEKANCSECGDKGVLCAYYIMLDTFFCSPECRAAYCARLCDQP